MTKMPTVFPPVSFLKAQWSFLLFGFLLAFFSSPGQTFFIALFSPMIRGELGLSHGDFGTIYAIATLASAACLIPAGRLVDTMRLKTIALLIILGLGCSALALSFSLGVMTLGVAIFCLRFSGQGMMTHLYATAIARRYTAERGRALAIAALGHPMSEFMMPFFALMLLAVFDWRGAWQATAILAWGVMIPAALLLTRTGRTQAQINPPTPSTAGRDGTHWTQGKMLAHWRFWLLIGLVIAPSFTATGLLFHQIHFAEIKAVAFNHWISGYGFYAITNILGAFIGGALVDKFTAAKTAPLMVANLALAPAVLYGVGGGVMIYAYFIAFGLVQGMVYTAVTPLWAEIYGTRYLGGIRAIAQSVMVFASALSPVLLGVMIDAGAGLAALVLVLAVIPIISGVLGYIGSTIR